VASVAVPARAGTQALDPLTAAQQLLDTRQRAIAEGDRDAFLATVDPEAPEAFREAQARSFDGWRALPLASYRLEARVDDTGDLAPPGLAARYGADRAFLPETRQSWRLAQYDDRDAVDALWLAYVERDGRWFVGGDEDLSALGLDTQRHLWELGEVRTLPTEHFLVLSHPEDADRADELAALGEEALAILDERWPLAWSRRIPIVLPGSADELEVILQTTFDLDNFVAFVAYGADREEGYEPTAPRMFIQDENLGRSSRRFQLETLVHELLHAAAAPLSGPFVPAWASEGVADWVATGQRQEAPPEGSDGVLPRDFEFTTGGGQRILLAYRESRSAVSFLAATEGVAVPPAFLQRLGAVRVAPGSVDHQVDQALREVAGLTSAELEQTWGGG
jgi:hypothetical protein